MSNSQIETDVLLFSTVQHGPVVYHALAHSCLVVRFHCNSIQNARQNRSTRLPSPRLTSNARPLLSAHYTQRQPPDRNTSMNDRSASVAATVGSGNDSVRGFGEADARFGKPIFPHPPCSTQPNLSTLSTSLLSVSMPIPIPMQTSRHEHHSRTHRLPRRHAHVARPRSWGRHRQRPKLRDDDPRGRLQRQPKLPRQLCATDARGAGGDYYRRPDVAEEGEGDTELEAVAGDSRLAGPDDGGFEPGW